jgi:hypothetical protein
MEYLADGAPSFLAITNSSVSSMFHAKQYNTPDGFDKKKIGSVLPSVYTNSR